MIEIAKILLVAAGVGTVASALDLFFVKSKLAMVSFTINSFGLALGLYILMVESVR